MTSRSRLSTDAIARIGAGRCRANRYGKLRLGAAALVLFAFGFAPLRPAQADALARANAA